MRHSTDVRSVQRTYIVSNSRSQNHSKSIYSTVLLKQLRRNRGDTYSYAVQIISGEDHVSQFKAVDPLSRYSSCICYFSISYFFVPWSFGEEFIQSVHCSRRVLLGLVQTSIRKCCHYLQKGFRWFWGGTFRVS